MATDPTATQEEEERLPGDEPSSAAFQSQPEQPQSEQPLEKNGPTSPALAASENDEGEIPSAYASASASASATDAESTPQRPPHPYTNASFFSKLFFLWPYPLLKLGMQRPLVDADLAEVLPNDRSLYNQQYLDKLWKDELHQAKIHQRNPDLKRAFFQDFLSSIWYIQPVLCAAMVAKVVQAICLRNLIEFFETSQQEQTTNTTSSSGTNSNEGYWWAAGLVLCGVVTLFEHHHVFFVAWRKGTQYRIASVANIYEKALRLSSTHQETLANYGRILNLASNDVERFLFTTLFISFLFWAPLQTVAICIVGSLQVGPAFMSGIAILVLVFTPLQFYLSKRFALLRSKIAHMADDRVNFVSQAIRGARVMKMAGYETRFLERIAGFRQLEIAQLQKANRLKAGNEALFYVTNVVVSYIIFMVHVYTGGTLTTGDVFFVFTLINICQLELIKHVSIGVMASSETAVSVGRIQQFLEFPERDQGEDYGSEGSIAVDKAQPALRMTDVSCQWNHVKQVKQRFALKGKDDEVEGPALIGDKNDSQHSALAKLAEMPVSIPLALFNVSVEFSYSSLTAVIGPVGSGKSALLQALVRELSVTNGSIQRNYKSIAYASQDPWVMDGTIVENITMGSEFDKQWYLKVVKACSLVLDFNQLRDGDQTIVGDRGVQLSGGQRARIGLARALYKDADVLVADDPLSAVDARVGRHLFQEAIINLGVNRGKCVVLATHQHQYVHDVRCLLVMNGQITFDGSYDECVKASNGKLHAHEADTTTEIDAIERSKGKKDSMNASSKGKDNPTTQKHATIGNEENEALDQSKKSNAAEQAERNKQGIVSLDTFLNYIRAMGGLWVGISLFCLFVLTQTTVLYTVSIMGRWAERDPEDQTDTSIIATVTAFTAFVIILAVVRAYLSFELTVKASQRLHDKMTESMLHSKIEFFDTNPLGRILNRFSADVGICDDQLPQTIFDLMVISFVVLGALITALTTLPFALAVVPFLIWYFVRVRQTFVTSTRELKRLEGIARSPIFAMLSEGLGGIGTIRSNDFADYFRKKFREAHDTHTRTFFNFIAASRWVGFRMDSIVFSFMAIVSFLSVIVQNEITSFKIDPAILGLSISMLIYLSGVFQWCIRQSAEVVNQMVSVERVLEYGHLESEAPLTRPGDDELAGKKWPHSGEIEYDAVSVRYRSTLPLALRKISFRIPSGARVGVVGRTGSGKSTVVQSLFRLLEPEQGLILIDGIDVGKIGLHALRTKISVIPQIPTLFSGCTVRENLDLFGLVSDDEIDRVLTACHMNEVINELPDGWHSIVSEGGSNFSVGQRQLLCLARAVLSHNKILVLDEATASVDRRTDLLLQEALQETYHDGTILAVAHRLDTVIDYDYILVLGQGEVLEFGSPADLIAKEDGLFARMVTDTGDAMSQILRERALQAQSERKKNQ